MKVTNKDTGYCFPVFIFVFEQVFIRKIDSTKHSVTVNLAIPTNAVWNSWNNLNQVSVKAFVIFFSSFIYNAAYTARFLKNVWPFFNIMHGKVKALQSGLNKFWTRICKEEFVNQPHAQIRLKASTCLKLLIETHWFRVSCFIYNMFKINNQNTKTTSSMFSIFQFSILYFYTHITCIHIL